MKPIVKREEKKENDQEQRPTPPQTKASYSQAFQFIQGDSSQSMEDRKGKILDLYNYQINFKVFDLLSL